LRLREEDLPKRREYAGDVGPSSSSSSTDNKAVVKKKRFLGGAVLNIKKNRKVIFPNKHTNLSTLLRVQKGKKRKGFGLPKGRKYEKRKKQTDSKLSHGSNDFKKE